MLIVAEIRIEYHNNDVDSIGWIHAEDAVSVDDHQHFVRVFVFTHR